MGSQPASSAAPPQHALPPLATCFAASPSFGSLMRLSPFLLLALIPAIPEPVPAPQATPRGSACNTLHTGNSTTPAARSCPPCTRETGGPAARRPTQPASVFPGDARGSMEECQVRLESHPQPSRSDAPTAAT